MPYSVCFKCEPKTDDAALEITHRYGKSAPLVPAVGDEVHIDGPEDMTIKVTARKWNFTATGEISVHIFGTEIA